RSGQRRGTHGSWMCAFITQPGLLLSLFAIERRRSDANAHTDPGLEEARVEGDVHLVDERALEAGLITELGGQEQRRRQVEEGAGVRPDDRPLRGGAPRRDTHERIAGREVAIRA